MGLNCKTLAMMAAFMISASARGPIIEVPRNYDEASPWKQLGALGLAKLKETDCQRTCVSGAAPRVCLYTLVLEHYSAMGTACGNCSNGILKDCSRSQCIPGDGHERGVMSINRMIPGPQIHVCKGDVLVILVENQMGGTGATLHWHGLFQGNSQWMDGVPYVTQCPIGGNSFRYVFTVKESGTYFYHSHAGLHRANGHYAPLIIREPPSEELWSTDIYDLDLPEHTMVLSDWSNYTAEMFYPGLPNLKPGPLPTALLLNGLGWPLKGSDSDESIKVSHPLATFHVEKNKRYRFRIINANGMVCPTLIQIENHNMTLIATDGKPIKPVSVDGVVSYAGERFDVIIDTKNEFQKNSFWIHIRGLGVCEEIYKLHQYAVLSYGTRITNLGIIPDGPRPTVAKPLPNNTIVNDPNPKCGASAQRLCISDLKAIGQDKDRNILTAKPDTRLFIPFGFRQYTNIEEFHKEGNYRKFMNLQKDSIRSGTMSNITFKFPSTPSLFLRDAADPGFCSSDHLPADCMSNPDKSLSGCDCPHVVTVRKDDLVEMILVNDDVDAVALAHPIHLHGFAFYVVHIGQDLSRSRGYTRDEVDEILRKRASTNKASNTPSHIPALKDTITVPIKGFAVVRWRATNPGDWLMHCHFEWHGEVGMMMILRVLGKIAPKPPGFPTCGNFDPLLLGA